MAESATNNESYYKEVISECKYTENGNNKLCENLTDYNLIIVMAVLDL